MPSVEEQSTRQRLSIPIITHPGSLQPSLFGMVEEVSSILSYNYNYTIDRPTNPDTWIWYSDWFELDGNLAPFGKAPKLLIDCDHHGFWLVSCRCFTTVILPISHLIGFSMLPAYSFVYHHAWLSFCRLIRRWSFSCTSVVVAQQTVTDLFFALGQKICQKKSKKKHLWLLIWPFALNGARI